MMGNIDIHYLISTISAIGRTLYRLGRKDVIGERINTLMKELMK